MAGVSVVLHQQYIVAGDVLSGDVIVTVPHHTHANEVLLFLDGKEKSFWEEALMVKDKEGRLVAEVVKRKDQHHFLKEKIILSGPISLQPGQTIFRFTHSLSPGLPATYSEITARPMTAKVDYELTAEVVMHHSHLDNHIHLTIGQRAPAPIMPVEVSNSKSFIFNKGQLGMRVELDRDVYFPGDEVKMKLEVNNASVKKVNGINVAMIRHLSLHTHESQLNLSDQVHSLRLEGLEQATKDSRFTKFQLPADFSRLTTNSQLVKASFEFKIECDVPMAIDLAVRVPVLITLPQHLDIRAKEYNHPEDVEHEEIVKQGDTYHERTPILLPDKTGDACACCTLF